MHRPPEHEPHWIATPHLRPDHRGPVDRPYEPFVDPASALTLLEQLQRVAARQPDAIALQDARSRLTFAALLDAAMRLRDAIDAIDAARPAPGRVGVLLPPSVEYGVAVFALLAAGRTAVLLDESYPDERNRSIANATGIDLVLCVPGRAPHWPGIAVLGVDSDRAHTVGYASGATPHSASTQPDAGLGLDEPAFILTTSGSSGEPKPIVHSGRTMLHWGRVTHSALHAGPGDRALSLSSLSTLGGFTGLIGFLLGGVTLHLFDVRREGLGGLFEVLRAHPVTILRAGASMLRSLAKLPEAAAAFANLRAVQSYGEPLMKSDVAALMPLLPPQCVIRSTYGSTEASGLAWFAGAPDDYDPLRVASGILLPDTTAAIVDDEGRDCPTGQPGELLIRSRYNALGEVIDGALVAGRLVPHWSGDGTRVFRTGDIARHHGDGVFVVLGRSDRMLKVNGQRFEPAEVEGVIRQVPGVERGEVLVRPSQDQAASPRLAAFVVPSNAGDPHLVARVRAALQRSLPSYMIPSWIMLVSSIPLLPGGKIDGVSLLASLDSTMREGAGS